jgi:hypothetical protein
VLEPGVISPHALRVLGVRGKPALLRMLATAWQAGFDTKPAFARGLLMPLVVHGDGNDAEYGASYDTQPFYAPWAFKEVEPGQWRIRDDTEVLPLTNDPSWSEERSRLRRKLWEKHHTCHAHFVQIMYRNYGRLRGDRILHYLLNRYKEHLEMAKLKVKPRRPKLWDFEEDREMSPAHKLQLWIKLQQGAGEAVAPGNWIWQMG